MKTGNLLAFAGALMAVLFAATPPVAAGADEGAAMTSIHAGVEKSFRRTKLRDRAGTGYNQARGRTITVSDYKVLGVNAVLEYYALTERDPDTGDIASFIVTKIKSSETVERDSSALAYTRRDAGAHRKHLWSGYSLHYEVKDERREIASLNMPERAKRAFFGQIETLKIPLATTDLFAPIRHGSALSITLQSTQSQEMHLVLPFSYLVGYFARAGESGLIAAEDSALATGLRDAIRAQTKD